MSVIISSLSTEYVKSQVRLIAGGAEVDPTGYTVSWAFKASSAAEPVSGDWVTGSWESDASSSQHWARCLVGPTGDIDLGDGTWHAWIKIAAPPETPVRQVGEVQVT